MTAFLHSFQSEWLKKRHSAAAWLTLAGGFFIPLIVLGIRFYYFDTLAQQNASADLWEMLYARAWENMAFFLLPMGVILATSLITQLEYKNNTWKQLHTTPQRLTTIYFAKLAVIMVMLLQFFILFNIGVFLTGIIPALLVKGVPFPVEAFPFLYYLKGSGQFLVACLPVVGLQYLLSMQFKNFLVPVGVGLGLYIAAIIAFRWKYSYIIPYIYCGLVFRDTYKPVLQPVSTYVLAVGYFLLFGVISYVLYIRKKEKG